MGKLGVMEHMDRLHPQVTKFQDPWVQITDLWLEFWEVFSRYPEGAKVTHQNMLYSVVTRSVPAGAKLQRITRKALTIFRNMAFVADNRNVFLNSEHFLDMVKFILDSEGSHENVRLVIVAVWKLLANSFKAKNRIKSTTLPNKLRALEKRISMTSSGNGEQEDEEHREEILMIVDMIKGILAT